MIRLFLFMLALILAGCSSTRVVERVSERGDTLHVFHRDTLREIRTMRDSIFIRDSVYSQGSQQIRERLVTRYLTRYDTIYKTTRDSAAHKQRAHDSSKSKTTRTNSWLDLLRPLLVLFVLLFAYLRLSRKNIM